jgi:hypothetical protein
MPEIYLGDSLFSGDISLSPTKGEGPLVRASSPTINVFHQVCLWKGAQARFRAPVEYTSEYNPETQKTYML